ncbi:MAG: hypothetical protein WC362_09035, partial [Methanoregula sp.]
NGRNRAHLAAQSPTKKRGISMRFYKYRDMQMKFITGVFLGGIAALAVSIVFPPIGALIGGVVAGQVAGGEVKMQAVVGGLSGVLTAVIVFATMLFGPLLFGGLLGLMMSTTLPILSVLILFLVASGTAGGIISSALSRYLKK